MSTQMIGQKTSFTLKHLGFIGLFIFFWILLRIPSLLHSTTPLNADVAVQLMMVLDWDNTGWTKFMWGSNYLGTLESLWNVLWFKILPPQMPYFWLPTALLSLACDLLFLHIASKILSFKALCILFIFLVLLPTQFLSPQIEPNLSYTTLALFSFLAILSRSSFLRGFLLGIAFYVQPISVYFTLPIFIYTGIRLGKKELLKLTLGFLPPFLFTILPIAGPALDLRILFGWGGERHVWGAIQLTATTFLSFLGFLFKENTFFSPPLIFILMSYSIFIFLITSLIKRKIFFETKLGNLPETDRLFVVVMNFGILVIPVLFFLRKYGTFDTGAARYLWLWHFSIYFFTAYLLGAFLEEGKNIKKIFVYLLLGLFIYSSLFTRWSLWKEPDHDMIFKNTIQYLRDKHINGIVGDYWSVYPISFFTFQEEDPIKSLPIIGGKRISKWITPVSTLPRVAYVCFNNTRCSKDKNPPKHLSIWLSNFITDQAEQKMVFQGPNQEMIVQIYEKDFDF